jgi:hypothetical protein
MPDLYVTMASPNPAGRDRTSENQITNAQLNAEWMQFENTSGRQLSLNGVKLMHYGFDSQCRKTNEDPVTSFTGSLAAGKSIRVHTGHGQDAWEGNVLHLYAKLANFVWNNRCGDTAVLRDGAGHVIDWAAYDPKPADGAVLRRIPNTNKVA